MLSSSEAVAAAIMTTTATLLLLMPCLTSAAPVDTKSGSAAGDPDSHLDMEREKRESFDMLSFLTKFGYLPVFAEQEKGQFQSEDVVTTAIEGFQRFNGLKVTGIPDQATLNLMKTPRCGVPDIVQNEANDVTGLESPMAYTTFGTRWMKDTVTWNVTRLSSKLPERDQWRAFQRALDLWENEIPIKFRFSTHQPDMEISFARGDHGDGWQNRFKGKGGVLAHAFRPGDGIGGDTHFDEDENWVMGSGDGTDLSFVAAHEFGHALGLAHSSVPGSLMQPFYRPSSQDISLHEDDIQGIQALYGSKRTPHPPPQTTTTTTTTTTRELPPQVPPFCDDRFRLDAISDGPGGFMYAYRADKIYKLGPNGLEFGSPQALTEVFPGAPRRHVRAVTYVPGTGKTYMFKNSNVWRFSGFQLDNGYPRVWSNDRNFQPSAALTLTYNGHSQIFMFGHDYFWEWSTYTESMVPGYPLASATYFPYAPLLPDAAFMNSQGNFIFFKYNDFKKLEHRGVDAESLPMGPNVFGSVCGGRPSLLQSHRSVLSDQLFDISRTSQRETTLEMNFSPLVWTLIRGDNDSDRHRDSLGDHGLSRQWHSRHHERGLGRWNRLGRVNNVSGYFTRKYNGK